MTFTMTIKSIMISTKLFNGNNIHSKYYNKMFERFLACHFIIMNLISVLKIIYNFQ